MVPVVGNHAAARGLVVTAMQRPRVVNGANKFVLGRRHATVRLDCLDVDVANEMVDVLRLVLAVGGAGCLTTV